MLLVNQNISLQLSLSFWGNIKKTILTKYFPFSGQNCGKNNKSICGMFWMFVSALWNQDSNTVTYCNANEAGGWERDGSFSTRMQLCVVLTVVATRSWVKLLSVWQLCFGIPGTARAGYWCFYSWPRNEVATVLSVGLCKRGQGTNRSYKKVFHPLANRSEG